MKLLSAALAGALVLTGGAQAADLMLDAPMEDVAMSSAEYDWSGFYAGVVGGYATGTTAADTGTTINVAGFLAGGTLGVNQQWGAFVLGVEGDVAWTNIAGSVTGFPVPGVNQTATLQSLGTVRARAGLAVDRVLLFATAGAAAGATNINVTGLATGNATRTGLGWTAGVGAEAAITENVSVKAEYAYTHLVSNFETNAVFAGSTAATVTTNIHTIKAGANFHF